jgi:hypothetical protein
MRGNALPLIVMLSVVPIVVMFAYFYLSQKEEVKVEYSFAPYIPEYSDILFSPISSTPGELPTEYLDLEKEDYFWFRYSIESSFMEMTNVRICPYISYTTQQDETKVINGECQEIILSPNEEKIEDINISLVGKKEEIKNSTEIFAVINITYSSNLRGLCDLYVESGYPSCAVSKNSEIKITPILSPNPIKLERDDSFSIDLEVERYGEDLTIHKIEAIPLETKVTRRLRDRRIEEIITVDGKCNLEKEIVIRKPRDSLRVCTLPQPKIKVKEEIGNNTTFQYFQLNCDSEASKRLKLCEILEKEKGTEVLKKLPIFLNVSFSISKSYSYRLFLTTRD